MHLHLHLHCHCHCHLPRLSLLLLIWGSLCKLPSSWPLVRVEWGVRAALLATTSVESGASVAVFQKRRSWWYTRHLRARGPLRFPHPIFFWCTIVYMRPWWGSRRSRAKREARAINFRQKNRYVLDHFFFQDFAGRPDIVAIRASWELALPQKFTESIPLQIYWIWATARVLKTKNNKKKIGKHSEGNKNPSK